MRSPPGPAGLRRLQLPIRTPRLLLRPPKRSDVPTLVPLVGDRRVARPTTIPHPYSRRDGFEFVRTATRRRRQGDSLALLIVDPATGRVLGGTGIHNIDWANRRFELGYWIAPADWGKGIATEAAYAVCRVAFEQLGLHRAYASVRAFNPRSARVLRKVGFRPEGRSRQHDRDGRVWVDVLRFGLLRGELRPSARPAQIS
jgi:RimJ/RimL family protein N-acetyltransferase